MIKKVIASFLLLLLLISAFVSQGFRPIEENANPPFITNDTKWVDSVFAKLTPEERIAQLFMVAAYSNKDKKHKDEISKLIQENKIGGLIFFQGGPVRQANLTNYYQSISKVPLLISIDGEWGLAMRLDSTPQFPRQMALGAIQNDSLIYEMGREIGRECKRMGIHVNFAPVADVNNNPQNPVIGSRSFGEDKYNVARKAAAYMKGLQDEKILANAKHFPGHGDTDSDSHKTLPLINHSKERMDSLELYPFKQLIKQGLGSMMVAHLSIPAYDTTRNTASTLSKAVVNDLLKEQLQFKGLVFTDALNMKGVSKFFKPGEVDVKALLAGNDVLLFAEDVPLAIMAIKSAIDSGLVTQSEIDLRCKKILLTKKWVGLDKYKPVNVNNLYADLNNPTAYLINKKLAENYLTLLSNKDNIIPIKNLDTLRIASVAVGPKQKDEFQKMLGSYTSIEHFVIDKDARKEEFDSLLKKLKPYNLVVVAISNTNSNPKKDFGTTPQQEYLLKLLRKQSRVVLNVFGNPYILTKFPEAEKVDAVLWSYEYNEFTQQLSAQLIFGGIPAKGKFPVTASPKFSLNTGITYASTTRVRFVSPAEMGINEKKLSMIDTLALKGIKENVYPGCQVLAIKDGKVFYNKAFGYHTYDNKKKVETTDLYDLASITKIASSTAALMKLVDEKKINLDDKLGAYLPELIGTNKSDIIIREMLTHQAGLPAWIPFWQRTVDKAGAYRPGIYSSFPNDTFSLRVAESLYMNKNYADTLYKKLVDCSVADKHEYKYSDLGFYFLKKIIELKGSMPLEDYVSNNFYKPLGLKTMVYKPRNYFPLDVIVPTENDTKFRKQLVHGDVHDPGAAMMGGVAGHAGLFSNALDLGVLMQLFLQKGEYGGSKFIDSSIVNEFIKCQYCKDNRRGVGFDKPETDPNKTNPVCDCVSYLSFGHSGFTGTLAWADPEKNIVYVFLSNRVYPNADDNKLAKSGIRSQIQSVIYEVLQ